MTDDIISRSSSHTYPIVVAYYRPPAQAILAVLPIGANLYLRPDPAGTTTMSDHNDPTAIAIYINGEELNTIVDHETSKQALVLELANCGFELNDIIDEPHFQLGYIPKVSAARIDMINKDFVPAKFTTLPNGKPAVIFNNS